MTKKQPTGLSPSEIAGARIGETRRRRGWSARQLAERCKAAGVPELTASVLANIESGRRNAEGKRRRDVTVDELLTLAYLMEVPPVSLLAPKDGERLQITSKAEMTLAVALAFFSGRAPAPDMEQRAHWVDIAERAVLYRIGSSDRELGDDDGAVDDRVVEWLIATTTEAFHEVKSAVPWDRDGGRR